MTTRLIRFVAATAAVLPLVGCSGNPAPPGSAPSGSTPSATQAAPVPPTGDLGVDCKGNPQEPVGPWQDWLIGPATSECDVTLADDLWLWVDDWYGSPNGYAIHVIPDRQVDKVVGHEVVIDNVEFLQDEEIHPMAVDGGEPRTLVYSTTCCYYDR